MAKGLKLVLSWTWIAPIWPDECCLNLRLGLAFVAVMILCNRALVGVSLLKGANFFPNVNFEVELWKVIKASNCPALGSFGLISCMVASWVSQVCWVMSSLSVLSWTWLSITQKCSLVPSPMAFMLRNLMTHSCICLLVQLSSCP